MLNGGRACRRWARAAATDEVKHPRREAGALRQVVAEQAVELRLLKNSMIADGGDPE
jgi:transposase